MARVAVADNTTPAALWVVAVDTEAMRGLIALVVMLPHAAAAAGEREAADVAVDAELAHAATAADVAAALRHRWDGPAADAIATEVEGLGGT